MTPSASQSATSSARRCLTSREGTGAVYYDTSTSRGTGGAPRVRGSDAAATRGPASVARRPDVRVVPEHVLRIVLGLDARQPLVLRRAVGGAHAILVVLGDEVDVRAGAGGMR